MIKKKGFTNMGPELFNFKFGSVILLRHHFEKHVVWSVLHLHSLMCDLY